MFPSLALHSDYRPFYEKGAVRIYYEAADRGFPLLRVPGGGLN